MQLEAGAELIVRRGWYEATDFWLPTLYRRFLFAPLKEEIDAIHDAGAFLTYSMNSGVTFLLPMFRELKLDILGNVDPAIPGVDLAGLKKGIGDLTTLYGGVNNVTVIEQGSPDQVRKATHEAVERLGPAGFILGPGDTIDCLMEYGETAEKNFHVMVEAYKECR